MLTRTCRPARGFTLIEILVVVVIIGIAAAVVIPQLSSRDDLRASAAARVVMADLIYAQNQAITQQGYYYVQFDTGNKKYTVCNSAMTAVTHPVNHTSFVQCFEGSTDSACQGVQLLSCGIVGASGNTQTTLGFDDLGTPMAYSGSGSPEAMSSGAIVLKCGTYKLEIDIEPYTGQISVKNIP